MEDSTVGQMEDLILEMEDGIVDQTVAMEAGIMEIVDQMGDQTLEMVVGTVGPTEAVGMMEDRMINQIRTLETMGGTEETVDQMGDQILVMEGGTVEVAVTAEDQIPKMDGIMVDHMEGIVGGTMVEVVDILAQVPRIQSGV